MNYTEYCRSFCISRAEWAAYRKRKKIKNYILLGLLAAIVLTIAIFALIRALSLPSYVSSRFTAELGQVPDVYDCLTETGHSAYFADGCDTTQKGSFKVAIMVDGKKYNVTMKVVDTVPPRADAQTVYIAADTKVTPEQFVTNIVDADDVRVTFKKKPNTSSAGKQEVTLVLRDGSGNESIMTSYLVVIKGSAVFSITIELGDSLPKPYEFTNDSSTRYVTDMSSIDFSSAGKYDLEITVENEIIPVVLLIKDTKAPRATVKTLSFYAGTPAPDPADFIVGFINEVDPEHITVKYAEKPNMTTPGRNLVRLRLTDASDNTSTVDTYVDIIADTEAPVIRVLKSEIEIVVGDVAIAWASGVEATDNSGWCELSLDTSAVDKKTAGRYDAYYVAKDAAGNVSRAHVMITVTSNEVTEEQLNEVLGALVEQLGITNRTTNLDKIKTVFNYVNKKISYVDREDHSDWRVTAYNGIAGTQNGDCFTFCSVSYALLRYLGFDVKIVERSPEYQALAGGTHFWVLVNIGTAAMPSWYHFDATPQRMPFRFADPAAPLAQISYLMTDAQIRAYTAWRDDKSGNAAVYYYACDFSKYPESDSNVIVKGNIPDEYYGR